MSDLSYLQAVTIGALQGVTELFPISSLGHSVLVPAWIGGSWAHLVTEGTSANSGSSPYLAFVVALHVATAVALLVFYRTEWVRLIAAFITSVRARRVQTSAQRLAWIVVIATIPVGVTGLVLEHTLRVLFARPLAAAAFLTVNGVILLIGGALRRRVSRQENRQEKSTDGGAQGAIPGSTRTNSAGPDTAAVPDGGRPVVTAPRRSTRASRDLDTLAYREALVIGAFQSLALLAGISRSGITMVAGLARGLDHEDSAKLSFLLATPVIVAAGVLKLPSLAGPAGAGIHGQVLVGALVAGVAAYVSVRFLTRWFASGTLVPFAVYSLAAGALSLWHFA